MLCPCTGILFKGLPPAIKSRFFHSGQERREVPMVPHLLSTILNTWTVNWINGLINLAIGWGQYHNHVRKIDLLCFVIICPSSQSQFAFKAVPHTTPYNGESGIVWKVIEIQMRHTQSAFGTWQKQPLMIYSRFFCLFHKTWENMVFISLNQHWRIWRVMEET